MMAHDLLTEPLLTWRDHQRRRSKTTLPGLLARLASGELSDFPRVQAHQLYPWCMFLAQLAAIALRRTKGTSPDLTEEQWRKRLLTLTDGAREPWCLVVEDLSKPAFFQPPVPEKKPTWLTKGFTHPDQLDILVTSKLHDVKEGRVGREDLEQWAYSLVTYQTCQGYPGPRNYPVARMKGAYGNRPYVSLAPDAGLCGRWRRDIGILLATWPRLIAERGFRESGIALTWLPPWDGTRSLDYPELAPHFIETCLRVRCIAVGSGIHCAYTKTTARRCLPQTENGDVGDPWIPIERDGGALTVGSSGFNCELLTRLILDDSTFEPAAAQVVRQDDGDPVLFVASALARGQGKTEGLHQRNLVIGGRVRRVLGSPDERAALGRRAEVWLEHAKRMNSKVLYPALKVLSLGGEVVGNRFSARVDEAFFDQLFGSLELDDEAARNGWDKALAAIARNELDRAERRCTLPDARRYRCLSEAESLFYACLRKQFQDLHSPSEQSEPVSNEQGVVP